MTTEIIDIDLYNKLINQQNKNKEYQKKYHLEYDKNNSEKLKEYHENYYLLNKDKIKDKIKNKYNEIKDTDEFKKKKAEYNKRYNEKKKAT